jgi:hypothetical protein
MTLALTPDDISKMTDDELSILVMQLQERRLRVHQHYRDTDDVRKRARKEAVTEQIARKLAQYHKILVRIDKDLETLELRMNQMRALKLELEDEQS